MSFFCFDHLVLRFVAKNLVVANWTYLKTQINSRTWRLLEAAKCRILKAFFFFASNMTMTDLVDTEPLGDAIGMVHMLAWQFHLLVPSFVPHLANHTSVFHKQ